MDTVPILLVPEYQSVAKLVDDNRLVAAYLVGQYLS